MDKLDHLPPLPLAVQYMTEYRGVNILMEQDRLGLYNALRLHDRVHRIDLELLPSIWLQVLPLMDKHFPILKCLRLSFTAESTSIQPLTLPQAFQAPNLRHLTLLDITPPRGFRFLTSTVSLVALKLRNIPISDYFQPGLIETCLPQLEILTIEFSISTSHSRLNNEREPLSEQGIPVTLPNLKYLWFKGASAYNLESLL